MQNDNPKFKINKKFLFVFLIFIISVPALYGYFKATSAPKNQGTLPKIEITPRSFDFGTAKYGEVLETTFQIKNLGNQTLEIKRVATSCACTKGRVDKKRLSPGEETELFVTYETGAMSGPYAKGEQERIVYVKSNDPKNPQVEVIIKAVVK
jgi:hypothetical protein